MQHFVSINRCVSVLNSVREEKAILEFARILELEHVARVAPKHSTAA